jgi:hypothetical protein
MLSPSASADTAGNLLDQCEAYERIQANPDQSNDKDFGTTMFCIGYVRGALEQMQMRSEVWPGACPPVPLSVSTKQGILIVLKRLREHPEHHHWEAAGEVFSAMAAAFPCK